MNRSVAAAAISTGIVLTLVRLVFAEGEAAEANRPSSLVERIERFRKNLLGEMDLAEEPSRFGSETAGRPPEIPAAEQRVSSRKAATTEALGAARHRAAPQTQGFTAPSPRAASQQNGLPRTARRSPHTPRPLAAAQAAPASRPQPAPFEPAKRARPRGGSPFALSEDEAPANVEPSKQDAGDPPPTAAVAEPRVARVDRPEDQARTDTAAPTQAALPVARRELGTTESKPLQDEAKSAPSSLEPTPADAEASTARPVAPRPSGTGRDARQEVSAVRESPQEEFLVTNKAPQLSVRVVGPKTMVVGRAATYRVFVANGGGQAANDVTVQVGLPAWAKRLRTTASSGTPQLPGNQSDAIVWTLRRLDISEEQYLDLEVQPERGQAVELQISTSFSPPLSSAYVEVQEPKLELVVAGPDETLYGRTERYQITVSNPGTGPAENVTVHLNRLGGGDNQANAHQVGTLGPGMSRQIDVELLARQTGTILVKAQATALGGLKAEAAREVLIRRPGLRVELAGPASTYAATVASYSIRLTNPGTAPAEDLRLSVKLPPGAEILDNSESIGGGTFSAEEHSIRWQFSSLAAEAEQSVEFRCLLREPGDNRIEVFGAAGGDLTDSTAVVTEVIAVADLTLELRDPTGPVQVGKEALYQIVIRNRGTKQAEKIDVVTFFSDGIEPVSAEGARHDLGTGQVSFHTIESLDADGSLTLSIRARALRSGNHKCRTEVHCKGNDTKLAAEESTNFYGDPASTASAASATGGLKPIR